MIDKGVLEQIACQVLHELGLRRWRVFYTDAEPETLQNKLATPANVRFHLREDDGETSHIIRVRIPAESLSDLKLRDEEIRKQLYAGLRRAVYGDSTH